jgi:hypothetical protein
MMRYGAIQEFGVSLKRHCAESTSMTYRSISTFYDEFGNLDTASFLSHKQEYLRQECLKPIPRIAFNAEASPYNVDVATLAPRKKLKRDTELYDPSKSRSSSWYRDYVLYPNKWIRKKAEAKKFRRRFRMPMVSFQSFIKKIRRENWFPHVEAFNALGQMGVPLEILVLGSLRYLGHSMI